MFAKITRKITGWVSCGRNPQCRGSTPCGKTKQMTTNETLPNPISATLPIPDVPSLILFSSTLAIKMAGHAVVGVLVGRRPREVWMSPSIGVYGTYRLDRPEVDVERSAMVALGGYVALNIVQSMSEPLAKGFCESALCTDVHNASMYFPKEGNNRLNSALLLLPLVHDILRLAWDKVKIVAAYLEEHWMIDGPTLGRLVLADENIAELESQIEDAQVSPIASPAVPMKTVDVHKIASVKNGEGTQVNPTPTATQRTAWDEFLCQIHEVIEARVISLEEGISILMPPTMRGALPIKARPRGSLTLAQAVELYYTSSQK